MCAREKGSKEDRIRVAIEKSTAFVIIVGRGSFKIAPAMKEFGLAAVERNVERFVFDMRQCVGMDSTFMGVLAGVAFRLKEHTGGEMVMVNLNSRTRGLLATLGLDQLIHPFMEGATPKALQEALSGGELSDLDTQHATERQTTETMLLAHETLVELCPENLPKFKDVLTFLREDLKAQGGEQSERR